MGYFINVKVLGGGGGGASNFAASCSIITKFGIVIEFDNLSPKSPKNL